MRIDPPSHSFEFEQVDPVPGQKPLGADRSHKRMHHVILGVIPDELAVAIGIARFINQLSDYGLEQSSLCRGHGRSAFANYHLSFSFLGCKV